MVSNDRLTPTWPAETGNQLFGHQGSPTGNAVLRATHVDSFMYTWYTISSLPLMRLRIAGLVFIDPSTCGPSCAEGFRHVSVHALGHTRP